MLGTREGWWLAAAGIGATIGGGLLLTGVGPVDRGFDLLAGVAFLAVGVLRVSDPGMRRAGFTAYAAGLTWFGANGVDLLVRAHRPLLVAAVVLPAVRHTKPLWSRAAITASAAAALLSDRPAAMANVVVGLLLAVTAVLLGTGRSAARRPVRGQWLAAAALAVAVAGPAACFLADAVSSSARTIEVGYAAVVAVSGIALVAGTVAQRVPDAALADRVVELTELGDRDASAMIDALWREDRPDARSTRVLEAVGELIERNRSLQSDLADRVADVRESRHRLVVAGDAERTRLSERVAEGAGRRLDELEQLVRALAQPDDGRTRQLLEQVRTELRATRDDLDDLTSGLHPRPLIEGGLAAALEELSRRAGPRIRVRAPRKRFAATVETTIWYVCAEAVTNATKHAGAGSIDVTVDVEDGWVVATVDDDGVGGATMRPGGGLAGLRDRLDAVGGAIDIELRSEGGTRLRARVPAE